MGNLVKLKTKICAHCNSEFIPKQNHPKYRFCSTQCKEKNYKAQPGYKEKQKEYKRNPESVKRYNQKRYLKYKEYFFANNTKRRAQIRHTSKLGDIEFTQLVVEEAHDLRLLRNSLTGIEWHVDHIIPLRGKLVCGLHIWNNFAVIPKVNNLRKGNYHSIHD